MRRQDSLRGFGHGGLAEPGEDLGWNDWGDERAAPAQSPSSSAPASATALAAAAAGQAPVPEILRQIERLAGRLARPAVRRRAQPAGGRRAAFTLRLDPERHLRLKVAGVVLGRSSQDIVTEALDTYLSHVGDAPAGSSDAAS